MSEKEIIFVIEESIDGGYEAKALGYSIFAQGDDIEDLKLQIRDAVKCHFEPTEVPKVIRLHWVREEDNLSSV